MKRLVGRLDQHMERQDEHMARQDEHMRELARIVERNTRAFEGLMAVIESAKAALLDLQDEARSQTRAILRVIDRLDGRAA